MKIIQINTINNKKPAMIELAIKLIDKLIDNFNYINLLIMKPFKAGAKEEDSFLISIDS